MCAILAGMTPFEKLTKARVVTGEAIKTWALAKRDLDAIRNDRAATSEQVFDLAQLYRTSHTEMTTAINAEAAAVLEAEQS